MTNTVDILKNLTQTTFDSVEGYRKAGDKAESPALTQALERRASERSKTLDTLNQALTSRGEDPITSPSTMSQMHQTWLSITDSFSNGNEAAAERVEEGEDYLVEQFRDVLEDDSNELDSSTRMLIQSAYREVREGERFTDMLEKQYA
ncbi:ferritin-like domain-containing protein [Erythrobacter rubeus]|uniref:PA2169 family four-helix-bundle protein n=1 Tax=Erythrobacter rubeus TaxID=2760803 RepID=A0ABR8KNC2_9SPHN|nr:PA2169 family four-helix-bundle protein [Erythrobacter rubeus]MBD2842153.1 PA2169 family four-helix-bundle protein [Erythrobacter rubeus]